MKAFQSAGRKRAPRRLGMAAAVFLAAPFGRGSARKRMRSVPVAVRAAK
jgi:hypothetical protein